ncbi:MULTISPECIES: hypothetical protein [unclassified Paenibacillus]|uniref:hypothetical protein n=1 Tax=unclassified Paenibacillus TaxID=185978 RepID=UPI00040D76AA|nr:MULTISPECIES: hypothetical protein [unclassified Paenibacillus]KGP79348.1 hypothetical protein P364_0124990 [Paenibacillus sp. MAEPY2]KGP86951.1 hypothetical protein P363_0115120 [Paenibacillus sp. MAEPY1]
MKKTDYFYLWIAVTSYMAGPVMYALTMYIFYQETDVVTSSLIGWTTASFSSVGILFILVTVILLRVFHIYYFWLQTLILELLFLVLVYMTPVLLGVGLSTLPTLSFPFTPEGIPLWMFWGSIALMSSWGIWTARQPIRKSPYMLVSRVMLILFILEIWHR